MVTDIDKQIERAKTKLLKGKLDEAEDIISNLRLVVHSNKEIDQLFQQCEDVRQRLNKDGNDGDLEDLQRPKTPNDEYTKASAYNNEKNETKIDTKFPGEVTEHVHDDFVVYDFKNDETEMKATETFEPEIEMIQNFLKIRSTVLLIGTSIWIGNPNIKIPFAQLRKIKLEIEYLIDIAVEWFYMGNFDKAYETLSNAEQWYNYVMPRRQAQKANPPANKTQGSVNDGSTIVRHKITVKGDEIDVKKRLDLAKAALAAGNFDKAERMINKANTIMLTTKAVELMNQVTEARAAAEKKTEVRPEPQTETSEPPEHKADTKIVNKKAVACVELANKAYSERKYIDARNYILQAVTIDPDIDVTDFKQDVLTILNHQSRVMVGMADDAFKKNDLNAVEKHLKVALELNFTDDINERLKKVSAEIKHRRSMALHFMEIAEEAKGKENFYEAEHFIKQAAKEDPSVNVSAALIEIQAIISHRKSQATGFLTAAEEAIKDKDYTNAEKCLLQAQKMDPRLEVKSKLSYVRAELASRSSSSSTNDNRGGGKVKQDKHCKQYNNKPYENYNILKRQAEELLSRAEEAFQNKGSEEAEELVKQANSIYYLEKSQQLTDRIDASRRLGTYKIEGTKHTESPRGNDPSMIQKTLERAREAYENENFERAERLFDKAYRMDPCDATLAELKKIRDERIEKSEHTSEETNVYPTEQMTQNVIDAQKYTDRALKAVSEKEFEQAINLLTESIRIYPTAEAKELLEKIKQVQEVGGQVTDDESDSETTDCKSKEANKDFSPNAVAVSEYVGFGLDEITKKCFYAADSWLKLANGIHKNETATQLLETVRIELKSENLKKPQVQDANKKLQAKHYLELAQSCLIKDEYDKAKLYVVIAQNITTMVGYARDLMPKIFIQQFSKENNVPQANFVGKNKYKAGNFIAIDNYKKFASTRFYECAEIALKMGNGILAQEYIEKCCEYNRNVDSVKLLMDLRILNNGKSHTRLEQFLDFCKRILHIKK